jgi:hypothetical protein
VLPFCTIPHDHGKRWSEDVRDGGKSEVLLPKVALRKRRATTHLDGQAHDAAHHAFMSLLPYTRTRKATRLSGAVAPALPGEPVSQERPSL